MTRKKTASSDAKTTRAKKDFECASCDTKFAKKDLGKKEHICPVCSQASVEKK